MLCIKIPKILLWLGLLGCCVACSDTSSSPPGAGEVPERGAAARSAIEERLITELAPTEDLPGKQRNAIINRAIDQNYDVYAAPEGYFYEVLTPGRTVGFAEGDYVEAHYTGKFLDGRVFDSSHRRDKKLAFRVGDLIPAWNLGVQRIKSGGSIRLLTPSDLAYGKDGLVGPRGDTLVPANTVLEFLLEDVEVGESPYGM